MADEKHFSAVEFMYDKRIRDSFRNGKMAEEWASRYPFFDDDDLRIHRNQKNYHFHEWLAAVLIFESTGYHTLMEKYTTVGHRKKYPLFCEIVGKELSDWICEDSSWISDLFCFSADRSDWFFCEVKGGRDKLRPKQRRWAKQIYKRTGKKTLLLNLKMLALLTSK